MREVCKDIQIEPGLQPVERFQLKKGSNTTDGARLDISARGLWGNNERTFFDVRITHSGAPSNQALTLKRLYEKNEEEKMVAYNDRVIQIEKGSFNPLVFTTSGGMAPQCEKVNKKLARLVSHKRKEQYALVMNHIR